MPVNDAVRIRAKQRIAYVSVMHSLIDFLCAFSLFARFRFTDDPFAVFLVYNFCAFALQLPLGIMLDACIAKKTSRAELPPVIVTVAGAVLTVLGTWTSPILLGLGNALFHTGGGVLTIQEDREANMRGTGLGVFVAPGAIGLFLGGTISTSSQLFVISAAGCILALLSLLLVRSLKKGEGRIAEPITDQPFSGNALWVLFCCFAVVILRSSIGFAETFAWKSGFLWSFAAVCMLAGGKTAGGFLAARFGMKKTVIVSLLSAAVLFLWKDIPLFGLSALFTFNMTMPLTLYLLAKRFPGMPGTAFGALTFALFIGYVLVRVYHLGIPYFGTAASLLSIVLLSAAVKSNEC